MIFENLSSGYELENVEHRGDIIIVSLVQYDMVKLLRAYEGCLGARSR